MNIKRIKADIDIAINILKPGNNPTNDDYIIDIAAYHVQQAIEKSIKYYLHNIYGIDENDKEYKIHNIAKLIEKMNSFNSSFLSNNNELLTSANLITSWEANTIYSNGICSNVNDINKCLSIAKKLYDDIVKIENNRISRDIQECKKNPLYLKNISFENQTKK